MSGVAVWSTPEWREHALAWLDARLAAAGRERTGAVEQPRVRPWATVLTAPTNRGRVWMKATAPATAFEVPLYESLEKRVPERVLEPIATDPARGWILLPDGGPSLRDEPLSEAQRGAAFIGALADYARLQRALAPHVEELLALGVADMRPAAMPQRFEMALAAVRPSADPATYARIEALRGAFGEWCTQLARSSLAPSLDHNDLYPNNILVSGGRVRFYDWGDSVIAHPFAVLLCALGFLREQLGVPADDPRMRDARAAYLEPFRADAPGEDLGATLDLACRVGKIARALVWIRALQTVREQGEPIPAAWSRAPLEWLASIFEESYLRA